MGQKGILRVPERYFQDNGACVRASPQNWLMLEQVKARTKQEELEDLTKVVGQAFFDSGKLQYEIDLKQNQLAETKVKLHNLNQKALELQKWLDKEARSQGMRVSLPTGAATPEIPGQ